MREARVKTILVVDDSPHVLRCYEELLRLSGYTVIPYRDGQSALLALYEGLSADLIITEYRMPGMDGLEFVSKLKTYAPAVPVIMCSLYMRADVYQKALSLGVVEYLEKPVSADELTRIVAQALEGPAEPSFENNDGRFKTKTREGEYHYEDR